MKLLGPGAFLSVLSGCGVLFSYTEIQSRPQTVPARFEVASIKPASSDATPVSGCHGADSPTPNGTIPLGRCLFRRQTIINILRFAYPLEPRLWSGSQIVGGPSWLKSDFFEIEAETESPEATTTAQLREMLQTLLKDKFRLAVHTETRELSGYYMLPVKDGFKLKKAVASLNSPQVAALRKPGDRSLFANFQTLGDYAGLLSLMTKMTIVDKTGIPGKSNIVLDSAETGDELAPSIFTAMPEQLGLKLEAQKILFDFIVIDHIEKPVELNVYGTGDRECRYQRITKTAYDSNGSAAGNADCIAAHRGW
jgi:uncharacterized protein (TIGR03435 family)